MALEAHRIQLVPPGEITACMFCGAESLGAQRSFVSFDNGAMNETVPAGLILSIDENAARRAYVARDAFGRGTTTIEVAKPQVCEDCLTTAARLIGWEDGVPLRAQIDEATNAASELSGQILDREEEIEDLQQLVTTTRAWDRLLDKHDRKTATAKKAA